MNELTEDQRNYLESLLIASEAAVRSEILQDVDRQEPFAEVASEAPDAGDASFAALTVDLGSAAVTRDFVEFRSIQTARERLQNGTYGDCVECGCPIPYERLLVQPAAGRCAPCQTVYEKTHVDALKGASM